MQKAKILGTVPLDFIKIPQGLSDWQVYETEDIFATNFINFPHDYLLTVGSAVFNPFRNNYGSLATTPSFEIPTSSQIYIAGRDVLRWGGVNDPSEIDIDHYGFTPDKERKFAYVWKAPKSEAHAVSLLPNYVENVPENWQEMFKAILSGEFKK